MPKRARAARRAATRRWRIARRLATTVVVVIAIVGATGGGFLLALRATRRDPAAAVPGVGATPASATTVPPTTAVPTTVPPTTTVATIPPPPARDPRRGNGEAVTLAFGGDVHFEANLRSRLLANPATALAPIAPVLSSADVAMVNLETAITERGTPPDDKEFLFRAPASALDALRAAGVDVATEANNHGLDYGPEGLADSLAARAERGFPVVGIGASATEAYAPFRAEVRGQRIAVLAATDVIDGKLVADWSATDTQGGVASARSLDRLQAAVRAARLDSDTVVVYMHWGVEGEGCPSARQEQLAHALVDAGADVVVGSHTHRVMGAGRLGASYVAYGLGNLAFYAGDGPSTRSGVLVLTVTGRDVDASRWVPARLVGGVATPLTGAAADAEQAVWGFARTCSGLAG